MPVTADHIFPAASPPGEAVVLCPIPPACPVGSGGAGREHFLPQAQKDAGCCSDVHQCGQVQEKNSPKPKPEIRLKSPYSSPAAWRGFVPSLKFLSWKDEPILFR